MKYRIQGIYPNQVFWAYPAGAYRGAVFETEDINLAYQEIIKLNQIIQHVPYYLKYIVEEYNGI